MNLIANQPIVMATSTFYSPPDHKEKFDGRVFVMITPSMENAIDKEAKTNRETRSDVVRRALELYYSSTKNEVSDVDNFTAPFLSSVPCGPWAEAIQSGREYTISEDVANDFGAREGDVFVSADGPSMEGAGILDGSVVLIRPYDGRSPRRGEIVLIQITKEDGDIVGTVKRFNGLDKEGKPKLLNGNDEPYPLPDSFTSYEIIGYAVGVVGRL